MIGTDSGVTCPQARRTFSRRKMLAKWQRDSRWKAMLAEHAHTSDAACVYCGRKHGQVWNGKVVRLTINHASRHLYLTEDLYLTWDPRYMEITCLSCNRAYERGQKPCPVCLKEGRIRYILDRETECHSCYLAVHPEVQQRSEENKAAFRAAIKAHNADRAAKRKADRHPCRRHRKGQQCQRGGACDRSPGKAAGCTYYREKKAVAG